VLLLPSLLPSLLLSLLSGFASPANFRSSFATKVPTGQSIKTY
jgi:hypothetical protein